MRNTGSVITVRPANRGDGPALARIDLATWTPAVSPAPVPVDGDAYQFFTERTVPGDVLVAEVNGRVAGWVQLQSPSELRAHAHVLAIGGLAVEPTSQGAGVGRRLVEAAVQECRRRGARKVTLRVLGSNAPARGLYERCGFEVEGVLHEEFRLQGRYVDDVLMARRLEAVP